MKRILCMLSIGTVMLGMSMASTPSIQPDALLLRFPDVSSEQIVFVYAGDIWSVDKRGGLARQLSSPQGYEFFPKYSPDGRQIAFSGNYDGNIDVYSMPALGGMATRLTHHPGDDWVVDWKPDGASVLYRSEMKSPSGRFSRLFLQPTVGGLPKALAMKAAEIGSYNTDGSKMIFQFVSRQFRTWKRYRGGMASDLWLYDFENNASEQLTTFNGTDALPMWDQNTLYFLSDRGDEKRLNIFAMDLDTREIRQITRFDDYDVKWPSMGPEEIVFENGGQLYLLRLEDGSITSVAVQIPADLPDVRTQYVDCGKQIQDFALSPSGKRALFAARGEVFTVPAEHGSIRNLTRSSAAAERNPDWSPDGKWVAYLSDKTGEYELYIRNADGSGDEQRITTDGRVFRYGTVWSPDSKKIAFSDKTGTLYFVTLEDKTIVTVDRDSLSRIRHYRWSPDSRWLAYHTRNKSAQAIVQIYDTQNNTRHQITNGYYHSFYPVFDPDGAYLYFFSNRTFDPVYGDMDATWIYPNSTTLCAVTLNADAKSPVAPRNDEETVKTADGNEDGNDEKNKDDKTEPKAVDIDFESINRRVVEIPVHVGNVSASISAVSGNVIFLRQPAAGVAPKEGPAGEVVMWDLKEREEKTIISGVDDYTLSADGKKLIYQSMQQYGIVDVAEGQSVGDGAVQTTLQTWIDPREEWKQLFVEAWRIERDFFYDPDMHGLNWQSVRERYEAMLPHVVDRRDLNYLIGEMIAELNASHSYIGGGDQQRPETIPVGLLGCDFELDGEHDLYRIKTLLRGGPWDIENRSPLDEPGVNVSEGDYLLAVNHQPVDVSRDPWAAFQGTAGEVVTLTVHDKPSSQGARTVTVKPLSSETRLRNLAWIEENRQTVYEATDGHVGYIYVPDTGTRGQSELVRQFNPQHRMDALIIDERFNSGGQFGDRFVELLDRPLYARAARRDLEPIRIPMMSHVGPKAMLINQWAGSGGDAFPYSFRKAGVGPLIGKRTWGGLIGISGNPRLIDGGYITAPNVAIFSPDGEWLIEGYGVDPDIEVENEPHVWGTGTDQQLQKAIQVLMQKLEENPPTLPEVPAYPDRSDGKY